MLDKAQSKFGGLIGGLTLACLAGPASAVTYNHAAANDSNGATTSFNGDINWGGTGAPSAGNDYVLGTSNFMRSPNTSNYSLTFGGDSLTLSNGGTLLAKGLGTSSLSANWIVDGGLIYQAPDNNSTLEVAGTVSALSGGANFASVITTGRNVMTVSADISGAGDVTINTTANTWPLTVSQGATSVVNFSGTNTYTGNTLVDDGTFNLLAGGSLSFLIGASGVNNQVYGTATAYFYGDFNFDLTGAGTTVGDSWNIVDVGNLTSTFDATFGVNGFADGGGGLWTTSANGADYQFDTSTGTLAVVPEPSAALIGGLGLLGLLRRRRGA